MADSKAAGSVLNVSKGVARGHVLCCCAVVFVCFMLTCLNLYMLSSTRAVLRHLDARLDSHPRSLQRGPGPGQSPEEVAAATAALLMQQQLQQQLQQQQLQQQGADDFVLLAPSDLDNAWTTQTGRLLVPVGQPEENDEGWKQMQVQLAEQTSAQQRHIENLHDKLADQYRAREELQRDQRNLMKEHQELSRQHQRQLAKKERQLLKEKHRVLKQGAKHQDQLRQVQSEVEQLKKVVEAVKSLDPTQQPASETTPTANPIPVAPLETNDVTLVKLGADESSRASPDATTPSNTIEVAVGVPVDDSETTPQLGGGSLDHIFSAVFGPSPGAYFFPSYPVAAERDAAALSSRTRRDLTSDLKERRERMRSRLASRLGARHRRHDKQESGASGPIMRIDGGQMVPLYDTPAVVLKEQDVPEARRRRLASHRGLVRG